MSLTRLVQNLNKLEVHSYSVAKTKYKVFPQDMGVSVSVSVSMEIKDSCAATCKINDLLTVTRNKRLVCEIRREQELA